MYRGSSCSLEKKGRDQYVYRDAFTAQVKDARGMLAFAEQQLAMAQRRVADAQRLVDLMRQELAQGQEPVTGIVKRYAPGATGDVDQVAKGAPPPIPLDEKKKRVGARSKR